MSQSVLETTQKAAWAAMQENNRQIRESRNKVLAWATATVGPSSAQEGSSQGEEGLSHDNEEISPDNEDDKLRPSEWSRYAYCEYRDSELPHEGGPCDCLNYTYDA